MSVSDFISLLGGVALFLFGMSIMGDALKKVAGNQLELVHHGHPQRAGRVCLWRCGTIVFYNGTFSYHSEKVPFLYK